MKCMHTEFDRAAAGHGTGMDCGLCMANRIAELEKALRDVKRFFEDERWGTVQYMESSDVYSDKDKALAAINSVL